MRRRLARQIRLLLAVATFVLTLCSAHDSMAAVVFQVSAPGVQQSAFQDQPSYVTENFNSLGSFGASGSLAVGNYTALGQMSIMPADKWGGADGTGTYAYTGNSGELTVTLTQPSKYLGLWFSAANPANYVDAYSAGQLLATFDTQALTDLLGTKASPNLVLASDGNTYSGALWYGNPNASLNDAESGQFIYAYVNMGLSDPNATFDKIVVRGNNFEFDNLTTSPQSTPVPEIDPAGMGSVLALVTGALGLLERRRRTGA